MYRNILLAYDGSEDGREALCQGAKLAVLCQATVHLVAVIVNSQGTAMAESVYPSGECLYREMQEFKRVMLEGEAELQQAGLQVRTYLCRGQPVEESSAIARAAQADLIVVGHREQDALARWWRGSVGSSLLANAPCSVLICVIPPKLVASAT